MWRRLLGHCQALVGDDATWRPPAAAALGDEAFLDGACCQAILDGESAEDALSTCYDLLSTEAGPELQTAARKAARRWIAKAQLGILVWRAGKGSAPRRALATWISRLLDAAPSKTPPDASPILTGWGWFAQCCKDFPSVPASQLADVRQEVEELVSKAHYDSIMPTIPEEHTLLGLLRQLPLFPPLRFDEIPEGEDVPDDYSMASRLPGLAGDFRELHLAPVMGLLACTAPRVRIAAALLFEMLTPDVAALLLEMCTPDNVRAWTKSRTLEVTEEERRLTLQLTNDPHPLLRRVAVKRLGPLYQGQTDPEVLAAVVPHLRDDSLAVRVAAARSVARLGPGDAVPAILDGLLPMLHEDAEPALAAALDAATAVGASLTDRHIDRIHGLLSHPSTRVTHYAARAIEVAGARAAHPQIAEALLNLFRHPEPTVRAAAVLAYGALEIAPNDGGLDELGRVLNSDPDVERAAVTAVRRLGRHVATHTVFTGLVRLLREGLVNETLPALEAIGPAAIREDVFAALSERFSRGSRNSVRAIVATARRLGPDGFARMLGIVAEKLGDPDASVRRLAVLVLGDLKAEAATSELLAKLPPLLQHPLAGVRESTASALEFIGSAAATQDVVRLLAQLKYDADRDVRFRAEDALYRLTGKR